MFNFKAFLVSGVIQRLADLGFSKQKVFSIAPDYIETDPALLPDRVVAEVVQHSRELVGDELWKLLPTHCHIGTYNFALQQVESYHSLGEFLPALSLFYDTFIPDLKQQFDPQSGYFYLVYRDGVTVPDFLPLYIHSFGYLVSCWLVGKPLQLTQVETQLPREKIPEGFEDFLGCRITVNADRESWQFLPAELKLPIVRSREDVLQDLDVGVLAILGMSGDAGLDYARAVSRYIYACLITSKQLPDQMQTAAHFGFGEQTFRRQLRKQDTSFRQIKQGVQHQLACELLSQTDLVVEVIAEKVGFIETNSFPRAFKQWQGVSPSEYRLTC